MSDGVTLQLSKDEALILFEWLARRARGDAHVGTDVAASFDAEESVFNSLQCALEKTLAEPFKPDYLTLLAAARQRILGHAE